MMEYKISTGEFNDGQETVIGYSGNGPDKNNFGSIAIHDHGPIPPGMWYVGTAFDDAKHGPCVMRLTPASETETFGRSGFLIHGDSIEHPGEASNGCIILPRQTRERINQSLDKSLLVTP